MIGEKIGKYKIIGHIGRGGMADVYKALHPKLNRVVAIKVLNRALVHSHEMLERFQREGQAIAALHHLNIVQVYDQDVIDGIYFMVMEYVEGETLAQRLAQLRRRGERMPLHDVLDIIGAVGEALHYAHEKEMLHRDIKPANVMFRGDGSVVLTDFGVAKILNAASDITADGAVAGTPAYMAPEQWTNDEPDKRSDIYSLGVVLYQVVTGELPFNAETPGRLMFKHISEPPPLPHKFYDDIPVELEQVILRTLAKDPDERYQTARELVNDLRDVVYQIESTAATGVFTRPTPPEVDSRPRKAPKEEPPARRRSPWLWLGAGAILALIILIGLFASGVFSTSSPKETPDAEATAVAERLATLEAALTTSPTAPQTTTPATTITPSARTPTRTSTRTPARTPARTPTLTPAEESPTPQSQSSPTTSAVCVPNMTLVRDVNYTNFNWWGTVNARLDKTWELRQEGDCSWPQGVVLTHLDGEAFGLEEPFEVEWTDEEIDLSVAFRIPSTPGEYEGRFQLQTPGGEPIGEPLTVRVEARPWVTPTPEVPEGPLEIGGWDLFEWYNISERDAWHGKVRLWAWGGVGGYTWYEDSLDNPLSGDILEFERGICGTYVGTVYVTSGDEVASQGLYIPYPEPCQ
ncbi:MAG: protein kinase [Anaerolineae bacterium]